MAIAEMQPRSAPQHDRGALCGTTSEVLAFQHHGGENDRVTVSKRGAALARSEPFASCAAPDAAAGLVRAGAAAARCEPSGAQER